MKSDKPDYFELHPEELKQGAKLVVARLVQNRVPGIKVPQIFDSIEDAVESGKPIVIRSDHPEEYSGLAGVLRTLFTKRASDGLEIFLLERGYAKKQLIKCTNDLENLALSVLNESGTLPKYLELTGRSYPTFLQNFKFTFWEEILGLNGAMWADPVIKGRYHFMQNYEKGKNIFVGYRCLDTLTNNSKEDFIKKIEDGIPGGMKTIYNLIEAYESIRNLKGFNSNHCYDMEYQINGNGNIYFLQLRRLRDFFPQTFMLDRRIEKGEIETEGVIGSTAEEGEIHSTKYAEWNGGIDNDSKAISSMSSPLFSSIRFPNLKVVLFHHYTFGHAIIGGHPCRELVGHTNLLTNIPQELSGIEEFIKSPIRYISDGNRCFIKRM